MTKRFRLYAYLVLATMGLVACAALGPQSTKPQYVAIDTLNQLAFAREVVAKTLASTCKYHPDEVSPDTCAQWGRLVDESGRVLRQMVNLTDLYLSLSLDPYSDPNCRQLIEKCDVDQACLEQARRMCVQDLALRLTDLQRRLKALIREMYKEWRQYKLSKQGG